MTVALADVQTIDGKRFSLAYDHSTPVRYLNALALRAAGAPSDGSYVVFAVFPSGSKEELRALGSLDQAAYFLSLSVSPRTARPAQNRPPLLGRKILSMLAGPSARGTVIKDFDRTFQKAVAQFDPKFARKQYYVDVIGFVVASRAKLRVGVLISAVVTFVAWLLRYLNIL